jgi:hypothetical protein
MVAYRKHDVGNSNIRTQKFSSLWLPTEGVTWENQTCLHRNFLPEVNLQKTWRGKIKHTYTGLFFRMVAYRRHDVGNSNIRTQKFSSVWLPTEGTTCEIQTYVHRSFLPYGCLQKARRGKIKHTYTGLFFRKLASRRCYVLLFVE